MPQPDELEYEMYIHGLSYDEKVIFMLRENSHPKPMTIEEIIRIKPEPLTP